MQEQLDLMQLIQGNWQVGFLYLLKILHDVSKKGLSFLEKYLEKKNDHMEQILNGLQDLKTLVQVHEAEIKNIKKLQE